MTIETPTKPIIRNAETAPYSQLQAIGATHLLDGTETAGALSVVEHPMPPRALAAPLHRHTREDEYSYVLEGRMGALLGDEVVYAEPGDFVFKPRNQWHTFWNAGDTPARIIEIIAPAGFEEFFRALPTTPPEGFPELAASYGLEVDPESIPGLVERFDLDITGWAAE